MTPRTAKEPLLAQIAGFVDLFIWLLVLKSFFLPLFIIPTGSMAETLYGAHVICTCTNCGTEFTVGAEPDNSLPARQCPNCRWRLADHETGRPVVKSGDRIVVHGWTYDLRLGPNRWDVVVFKVPSDGQTNYIKRLIGLPNETIEIVGGDVFVDGRLARKNSLAQSALWHKVYDHDRAPLRPAQDGYFPRWVADTPQAGWSDARQRVVRFAGRELPRQELRFVTDPAGTAAQIGDVYGYNGPNPAMNLVDDLRLSCEIRSLAGDGRLELCLTKGGEQFFAVLTSTGAVRLDRAGADGTRVELANARVSRARGQFSLAVVDYQVVVELDGHELIRTTDEQFSTSLEEARRQAAHSRPAEVLIAAERAECELAHLLLERDVYYTTWHRLVDPHGNEVPIAGRQGIDGHPIKLGPDEFFVCGDNSPKSHDSRFWRAADVAAHLRDDLTAGAYQVGTVPRDQMIGRAFLVYWPGFMPLFEGGWAVLPDLGRVRWIH